MNQIKANISSSLSASNIVTNKSDVYTSTMISSRYTPPKYTSQKFSEDGEYTITDNLGITSSVINDNNALIMLETIKNLLIRKNYFTEEEFTKEYGDIQKQIELRINGYKVANKLTEKNY